MYTSQIPRLMLKLDFEKAFNNFNWNFLINTLKGLGCGEKWIDWIRMCVTSAKFSILVNRSPKGTFFRATNGLRQGDHLSPLLFIVTTHILDRMLVLENRIILLEEFNTPILGLKY